MKPLSARERIALWFAMNTGWEAALVIGAASLVTGMLVFAIMVPVGPDTTEAGTIRAFGLLETDTGSRGRISIETDGGRRLVVHAPDGHACRVGDRVIVVDETMIWGKASRLRRAGCAA